MKLPLLRQATRGDAPSSAAGISAATAGPATARRGDAATRRDGATRRGASARGGGGPGGGARGQGAAVGWSHPELWAALGEVMDPELPVSIVELGLVYGIRREGGRVEVDLTFTAIACPCMDLIRDDVTERLLREPGVDAVEIHEVWDPPWTRSMISDAGREALRRVGVAS